MKGKVVAVEKLVVGKGIFLVRKKIEIFFLFKKNI